MFRSPFSFEGRIRRTEFGLSVIIYSIPYTLIYLGAETMPILIVLYIPILWFLWAQGAKRCHDRNNSGWFQIIPLYSLWMLFAEGDAGNNEYGPDPKNPGLLYTENETLDSNISI